jgi:hypothetical protein
MKKTLVTHEVIADKIIFIRGRKVMLDRDLAKMYGLETKVLNQAVKRNIKRFPDDFMFQLSKEEFENWKSQFVTSDADKIGLRRAPYAFTDYGILMLSSVLHSKRAIQVNITIMRVFVRLREFFINHTQLSHRLAELEKRMAHKDEEIKAIFEAIRQLMAPAEKPKRRIGFHDS